MKKTTKTAIIAATLTGALALTACEPKEVTLGDVIESVSTQVAYGIVAYPTTESPNENMTLNNQPDAGLAR